MITVLGAGVVGLSTAVVLAEGETCRYCAGPWCPLMPGGACDPLSAKVGPVTIVADRFTPHTTSDGAGALWQPFGIGDTPEYLLRRWSYGTFQV